MHGVAIGSRVPLVLTGAKTSGTALPQHVEFVREARAGNRALDAALVAMGAGSSGLGGLGARIADSTAPMVATSCTAPPPIGRVSCRCRICQDGGPPLVGGLCKKKFIQIHISSI